MDKDAGRYRVFIVRCWQEERPDNLEEVVRYTLDVPALGERRGFNTIDVRLSHTPCRMAYY